MKTGHSSSRVRSGQRGARLEFNFKRKRWRNDFCVAFEDESRAPSCCLFCREREKTRSKASPSVCERIFHYFDVTPFLRMREISEASFSLLARWRRLKVCLFSDRRPVIFHRSFTAFLVLLIGNTDKNGAAMRGKIFENGGTITLSPSA